jgi:uncharacterized membrane protein YccC
VSHGRRYPKDLEAPQFIHPSSEPMMASMKKQDQIKEEIKHLLNLTIASLRPVRASAESKKNDQKSLESGLSYIGLALQQAENAIAEIWNAYEGVTEEPTIKYPQDYSLKTQQEKMSEAEGIFEMLPKLPSMTYQKEMGKKAARILLQPTVPQKTMEKIDEEIASAPNMTSDPESIREDVEAALVTTALASKLRGYPEGEAEKAKEEHVERAEAIAKAQASAAGDPGARGVKDLSANPNAGRDEKKQSRDTTLKTSTRKRVRGEGKSNDS